jgi:hypothetical protein
MKSLESLMLWIGLLCTVAGMSGCQSENKPETYPVSGKVLYRGQPAEGVQVILQPQGSPTNPEIFQKYGFPNGVVEKDGTFKVTTYANHDGAPPGMYVLLLTWPGYDQSDPDESEPTLVDLDRFRGQYSNPQQAVAVVTVERKAIEIPTCDLK